MLIQAEVSHLRRLRNPYQHSSLPHLLFYPPSSHAPKAPNTQILFTYLLPYTAQSLAPTNPLPRQHINNRTPPVTSHYVHRASVTDTLQIQKRSPSILRASCYSKVHRTYNAKDIKTWKEVTDVVHKMGGVIYKFCQL